MRFGLLAVLVVAVLVPSLSEGRIVSKCELRERLGHVLPPKNKDNILARVICEVGWRTQFDTSRLTVNGKRPLTPPGPVQTTGVGPIQTRPEMTGNMTTQHNQTAPSGPAPAQPNQIRPGVGPVQITGVEPTNVQPNQTRPGVMVPTAIQPHQTTSNGTKARHRRGAKEREDENESNEASDRSSLGLYGLFQLSDHIACNSGYYSSKNVCKTQCDVFVDDDIADDIACLVQSHAWEDLLSGSKCSPKYLGNYFAECVK